MEIPVDVMVAGLFRLVDDLARRGYVVDGQRYDRGNFGNAEIVLSRDKTRARLVRNRGEWFVEVAPSGLNDWFKPVIWRASWNPACRLRRPFRSTTRLLGCLAILMG